MKLFLGMAVIALAFHALRGGDLWSAFGLLLLLAAQY